MFAAADKDGSGRITQEELQAALDENEAFGDMTQKMGTSPDEIFAALDTEGTGDISFKEFVVALTDTAASNDAAAASDDDDADAE